MSSFVARPDATLATWANHFAVSDLGTVHHALADDTDPVYVYTQSVAGDAIEAWRVGFNEPTGIPGTARITGMLLVWRVGAGIGGGHGGDTGRIFGYLTPNGGWSRANFDFSFGSSAFNSYFAVYMPFTTTPTNTQLSVGQLGNGSFRMAEAYAHTTYVNKPVATLLTPATGGPAITDDNQPTFTWSVAGFDGGGAQAKWQVKVFDSAHYPAGDPGAATGASWDSGVVASAALQVESGVPLVNGSYRWYLRQSETVNGSDFWSDWAFNTFTLSVSTPNPPTITSLTPNNTTGCIAVNLASAGGAVSTDYMIVQRSDDGGTTWSDIRAPLGGFVSPYDVNDYEAPNGGNVRYRAAAVHIFATGTLGVSAWTTSAVVSSWSSTLYWLKHPTRPSYNVSAILISPADGGVSRDTRRGVFQPVGSATTVTVTETAGAETGSLKLFVDTQAAKDALTRLYNTNVPVLLQMHVGDQEPDRWLSLGNWHRERFVDRRGTPESADNFDYVRVDRPAAETLAE